MIQTSSFTVRSLSFFDDDVDDVAEAMMIDEAFF